MGGNYLIGFSAAAVAVLCFGTNFIPVKQYNTGDGMFFQWVMCMGVWTSGLVVQFIRSIQNSYADNPLLRPPIFEPFAALGGVLWCCGNVMAVPIIQCIGLSLGMLVWCASSLFTGWACGYFGLLGVTSQSDTIGSHWLNIFGVALCLVSVGAMFFIETELGALKTTSEDVDPSYNDMVDGNVQKTIADDDEELIVESSRSWTDNLSPATRRIVGIGGALLSGVFYGTNFNPPQNLIDNPGNPQIHSTNNIDYVFSHFCGILLTSTLFFIIYCIASKNKPFINPEIALPSFISGSVWSLAQIGWFVANGELLEVVSFPIISTGPGIVAALCGIFLFNEIQGRKNFIVLSIAIAITLTGVTCIGISKVL